MQYQLVYGQGNNMPKALDDLEERIRDLSSKGWRPQGGVSIAVTCYEWYYACQAMVK